MARARPRRLSASALAGRVERVAEAARRVGFVGRVEYRHVYSQAGGAQYGLAATVSDDLLIVYAEAFERDADPKDFSLEAIIAHERGHQLLARHARIVRNLPTGWSTGSEEIVASLVGSLLVTDENDREALLLKSVYDAATRGMEPERASRLVIELRTLLERLL